MTKKLAISTLLILLSSAWSKAQVHLPFPMHNCTWKHTMVFNCTGLIGGGTTTRTFNSYTSGDTVIGSNSYAKIYTTLYPDVTTGTCSIPSYININISGGYWGAMRQTDDLTRVYLLLRGENTEELYYDFTLSQGDTLKGLQAYPNYGPPRIVDSVYYQTFSDGICRKVYTFSPGVASISVDAAYLYHFDKIIEGLGMNTGLYYMLESGNLKAGNETMVETMTVEINGSPIVPTSGPCMRDVGLTEQKQADVKLWPNPGSDLINISGPGTSLLHYKILDVYGREVVTSEIPVIKTENLPPGVYFVVCNDHKGTLLVHRWVKI